MIDRWKVVYYISTTGENPVSNFLNTLQKQTQSKIIRILHNIEEYGLRSVIPHIKKTNKIPIKELEIVNKRYQIALSGKNRY